MSNKVINISDFLGITIKYDSWEEVMEAARSGKTLYYWAPMDSRPTCDFTVKVQKKTLRLIPPKAKGDPFTADQGHLDRFVKPHHTIPSDNG